MGWIIILVIFGIIGFIIIIGIMLASNQKFKDNLEKNINNEIKNFLISINDSSYQFRDEIIISELRNRLRAAIIDLRSNGYKYKSSYLNRTTTKDNEIKRIIKKYYKLDQQRIIDISLNNDSIKEVILLYENNN